MKKIWKQIKTGGIGLVMAWLLAALILPVMPAFAQSSLPSSITFPAGPVGTAESGTLTTVFTNNTASTITSITVTAAGTNSADFGLATSPSTNCGGSLTAGSTCTITVTFTPGGYGARVGQINIAWAGNAFSPFVVYLAGSGVSAATAPTNALNTFVQTAYTNATTSFTSVIGLAFPIAATQQLTGLCYITWQGSASTTGPKYQVTGPGSPTAVAVGMNSIVTATSFTTATATAFSSAVANTGTVTATTNFTDRLTIGVANGANAGTLQVQAAANGAGTLTIQPGSFCVWQ